MGKECWDCYYSKPTQGNCKYRCEKRMRTVNGDDTACSYFVSDDTKTCLNCYFSEVNTVFLLVVIHIYALEIIKRFHQMILHVNILLKIS